MSILTPRVPLPRVESASSRQEYIRELSARRYVDSEMIDACNLNIPLTGKIAIRKVLGIVKSVETREVDDREAARRASDNVAISETESKNFSLNFHNVLEDLKSR